MIETSNIHMIDYTCFLKMLSIYISQLVEVAHLPKKVTFFSPSKNFSGEMMESKMIRFTDQLDLDSRS